MLANSAGYFNIGARDEASATIEKTGKVVVPEPEPGPDPEPTYTVVDETDMLADTENWTLGYDSPTFASGSITAKTETDFSIGGYNKPVKLNTVYRFRYKNVRGTGWYDGFYLGFSPANIYWSDGGVQVDFNDGSTALHFYKAATEDAEGNPVYQPVLNTAQSPSIVSGQEYEIEFGLLKVSDDTVKVHLTINGTPYFADVEVKNSVFVTKPLYFGIFSRGSEAMLSYISMNPRQWQEHSYVACCGTSPIPVMQMLKPDTKMVYLCLDNDDAGHKASERMAELLHERGVMTERLVPELKDWNEDLLHAQKEELAHA